MDEHGNERSGQVRHSRDESSPTTRIQVGTDERVGTDEFFHILYTAAKGPMALATSLAPCAKLSISAHEL